MTLNDFNQMYEEILHSNLCRNKRDRKLAQLMTIVEQTYKIPMLKNCEWEKKNKEVINLYRKISLSRHLK